MKRDACLEAIDGYMPIKGHRCQAVERLFGKILVFECQPTLGIDVAEGAALPAVEGREGGACDVSEFGPAIRASR